MRIGIEIWELEKQRRKAEKARQMVIELQKWVFDNDLEPEIREALGMAHVKIALFLADTAYYTVVENSAAKFRRERHYGQESS